MGGRLHGAFNRIIRGITYGENMEVKSKKEIEEALTESAKRVRIIREKAEAIKSARLQGETESAQRSVGLIKPGLSPIRQRER